jgi:CubicO group peptidase (beta-lactamase class C family)
MTNPITSRRTLILGAAATGGALCLPALTRAQTSGRFADAASYSADRFGVSVLVEQNRRVLFEDYPGGGATDAAWELASGTKSFSGIMAAALAHDGLLRLDERCADSLPDWRTDPAKSAITIGQLLTLTSGVGGGTMGRPPSYADAVAFPLVAAPGTGFAYGPVPFQVFGAIVAAKLAAAGTGDADALAYLQRRIFTPLGIMPQRWRRTAAGDPHLPSGAALTARDWARFGRFVLDAALGNRQPGDPALDPSTLAACFVPTAANPGYGLTWWLPGPGLIGPGRNTGVADELAGMGSIGRIWLAAGAGNQRLYLMPDRNLVIVRQATRILAASRRDWSDRTFLQAALAGL